jgi:predicted alpha/beta-fold hydrolase
MNPDDALESMTYVYERYCKDHNRKVFAVGLSTGANILTHLMAKVGNDTFITAASALCIPGDLKLCVKELPKTMRGFYNRMVGTVTHDLIKEHFEVMEPLYRQKFDIDLQSCLDQLKDNPSLILFDELI